MGFNRATYYRAIVNSFERHASTVKSPSAPSTDSRAMTAGVPAILGPVAAHAYVSNFEQIAAWLFCYSSCETNSAARWRCEVSNIEHPQFECGYSDHMGLCLEALDAESLDNCANASCTVVMNCARKMMVEFLSTKISAIVCRVRS
jgi:hypothetical protein